MNLSFKSFAGLALLFITVTASAQQNTEITKEKKRYEHVKERNISKTYSASGNTLNINNSFGDVVVTTWNRNEIKVDVHIEASSTDKEIAEKIFENLDVTESKDGNEIKLKTTTSKDKKGTNINCKNCKTSMNITYTVQLPANVPLKIENSFGAITIPDYTGAVSLVNKFGSLTAGNLSSVQKLEVEFGKANLKNISNANSSFKFSTVTIQNMSGNNKVNLSFCGSSRINLGNDVTSLQLNESYSTVNLRPSSNFSGTYEIKTSFGSVTDRSNANIKRTDQPDKYGPDSNRSYEGKSGSGSSKVEVKSSFGRIIIGEATEAEMKEKKKEKNKTVI
ncbi:MAG: hypothetical protein GXC73_17595 [Chitinophagaceae bacterium]|nr:hypothetical protein [Chitinophagaceae bacterium]